MKKINIDNFENVLLKDGLTMETLKTKYNWIFSANIKNAIIGEDNGGLIWYDGEWNCKNKV